VRTSQLTVDLHWDSSLLDVGYLKNWYMVWVLDKQASFQRTGVSLMDDSRVPGQVKG